MKQCLWILAGVLLTQHARAEERFFETSVQPLLIERCVKCHGPDRQEGKLRLDSHEAVITGGESGAAVVAGEADESPLIQAVRHENGLKMPPDGKLPAAQVDALVKWVREGARWPGAKTTAVADAAKPGPAVVPKPPNGSGLAESLQLWLRADALQLADGESVPVWPDQSGHGR